MNDAQVIWGWNGHQATFLVARFGIPRPGILVMEGPILEKIESPRTISPFPPVHFFVALRGGFCCTWWGPLKKEPPGRARWLHDLPSSPQSLVARSVGPSYHSRARMPLLKLGTELSRHPTRGKIVRTVLYLNKLSPLYHRRTRVSALLKELARSYITITSRDFDAMIESAERGRFTRGWWDSLLWPLRAGIRNRALKLTVRVALADFGSRRYGRRANSIYPYHQLWFERLGPALRRGARDENYSGEHRKQSAMRLLFTVRQNFLPDFGPHTPLCLIALIQDA